MNKELKIKTALYALAILLSLYAWWSNGAQLEDQFMIWMGAIFIIGCMEAFGYVWDMVALAIKKMMNR